MPAASTPSAWPTRMRASSSGLSSVAPAKACASATRADAMVAPAVSATSDMSPRASMVARSGRACFRGQELGLMLGHERIDDLAQRLALDDLRQLVKREVDAVVAHAPLREIVGADALGAIAGADLAAPLGGAGGVLLLALVVVEPRAQHRHRLGAVAVL